MKKFLAKRDNLMNEIQISNNLYYQSDDYEEHLAVKNPVTGDTHGLNLRHISPDDLIEAGQYLKNLKSDESENDLPRCVVCGAPTTCILIGDTQIKHVCDKHRK